MTAIRGWMKATCIKCTCQYEYNIACIRAFCPECHSTKYLPGHVTPSPCEVSCVKCGGRDISLRYIRKGIVLDPVFHHTSFTTDNGHYVQAKKECISFTCNLCQYKWTGAVKDKKVS